MIAGFGCKPPSLDYLRLLSADITEGEPKRSLGTEALTRDCGRDAHYWAPPAQNRTGSFPAYGSHLG
jgi:hypothetical protein